MTDEPSEALKPFLNLQASNPLMVRRVLNLLTESPFFYRSDDADAFDFLRYNRRALAGFFKEIYDWELAETPHCFRLSKTRWENTGLSTAQRLTFDLASRNECLAFLFLLLFYERRSAEEDYRPGDAEPWRFRYGTFFDFARERFAAALHDDDGTPQLEDAEVQRVLKALWPKLLRYRFIELLPFDSGEAAPDRESRIYTVLPAMWSYNTAAAADIIRRWEGSSHAEE